MGCRQTDKTWHATAATDGDDSTPLFTPLSQPIPLADIGSIATALELVSATTNFEVRPAYRTSNDGVTWTGETGIGDYQTASGWHYEDFTALAGATGRLLQVGVQAINATSTTDIAKGIVNLGASFKAPPAQDFELDWYDLSSGHEGVIANGFTASVTEQSSGYHRVQLTGQSAIDDGIAEMYVRTYTVRDSAGAVVDLSEGNHGVVWEILVDDSNFPSGEYFLFHFGPVQVAGSDLATPTSVDQASFMGFKSGSGAGNRGNSRSTGSTNATTTKDGARRMRAVWIPQIDEVGNTEFGHHVVQWLSASDELLASIENLNSSEPDLAKPWGMALALGFDASHTNTHSADIQVGARAFELPAV